MILSSKLLQVSSTKVFCKKTCTAQPILAWFTSLLFYLTKNFETTAPEVKINSGPELPLDFLYLKQEIFILPALIYS